MEAELIAYCGMNCAICSAHLRKKCPGCKPRAEGCKYYGGLCEKTAKGGISLCFECDEFPCKRLKALDKRYKARYHMSMIENLECIRDKGMKEFLKEQEEKYNCYCGGVISVHDGECYPNGKKPKTLLIQYKDERVVELVKKTGKKILAAWAIDCAERVLHYFEERYPEDNRPQKAIEALQKWIKTGVFRMADIRAASLASHAAAREVGKDTPARSAARAAGQAVATAHVPTHSMGAAIYALQAVYRATNDCAAVAKERDWQYKRLVELAKR